ncbi:MAG: hypothetical protein HYY30_02665 [Chloroflexi bacterium]|nr:hypothetical protein [Chloroflexota bacterium]
MERVLSRACPKPSSNTFATVLARPSKNTARFFFRQSPKPIIREAIRAARLFATNVTFVRRAFMV